MKPGKQWAITYLIALLILALAIVILGLLFETLVFRPVSVESIVGLLVPLFVIALFLERAQEVFIVTWRRLGRTEIGDKIKLNSEHFQEVKKGKDPKKTEEARQALITAQADLSRYKEVTARIAFLIGLSAGILISIVGVRVLDPLIDFDTTMATALQVSVFKFADIVVTGGLIGGGADGIHKLVSVITDFLEQTRAKIRT